MLKHILTGQPSSTGAGSRLHQQHDYLQTSSSSAAAAAQQREQQQREHSGFQHGHQHVLQQSLRASTRAQSSADVYDNVQQHQQQQQHQPVVLGQRAGPQYQSGRHPLNHSQLSVNNLAQRLNASHHSQHALNLSMLSTSKHSVNSVSPVVGAHLANYAERPRPGHPLVGQGHALVTQLQQQQSHHPHQQQHHHQQQHPHLQQTQQQYALDRSKINGGLDISRMSRLPSQPTPSPAPVTSGTGTVMTNPTTATTATTTTSTGPSIVPLNISWSSSSLSQRAQKGLEAGVKEVLTSLGLLCLVSLLLALLSLTFLIRMSSVSFMPNSLISAEEFAIVYDVTLVLCALALSLNLCCLLVCAIQFLFAVKLVKSLYNGQRTNKYLQKSSISRVCAIGGFFISIPVFLTGMILYTFIQFQSTPAIVTSAFIGLGIVFCGCALVHTVFVWQKVST